MNMMAEVEELPLEQWNSELKDEILSKTDPSSAASEILGQIVLEMTSKFMLPQFIPYITKFIMSPNCSE